MKNYTDHYNHIDPSAESKKRKTIYKLATENIYQFTKSNKDVKSIRDTKYQECPF
jgi:hypothetical protein